jgi:hypothetical protein
VWDENTLELACNNVGVVFAYNIVLNRGWCLLGYFVHSMGGVYVGAAIYYIFVDLVVSIGISMRYIF